MLIRYSTLTGDPARIDDLTAYVRGTVQPTVIAQPGCEGLGMWVQRETGEVVVGSMWTTRAELDASEAAVAAQRAAAGEIAGGATPEVVVMDVLLIDMAAPQQPGSAVRGLRITADPAGRDEQLAWSRETVIPQLRTLDGYQSYVVHQGSEPDQVLVTVAYRDAATAQRTMAATEGLRAAFPDHGMALQSMTTYETVLMAMPGSGAIPTPRTVDVTERTRVR